MTFIKATKEELRTDQSYKSLVAAMPRTDFTTIYQQVKDELPDGHLYYIVEQIACYRNTGNMGIGLDEDFCTDDGSGPKPNGEMANRKFKAKNFKGEEDCISVAAFLRSIEEEQHPDRLTQVLDGSIGGLGTTLEKLVDNPDRAVPLWEWRQIPPISSRGIPLLVGDVENAVMAWHRTIRRLSKRDDQECGPPSYEVAVPTTLLTQSREGDYKPPARRTPGPQVLTAAA